MVAAGAAAVVLIDGRKSGRVSLRVGRTGEWALLEYEATKPEGWVSVLPTL